MDNDDKIPITLTSFNFENPKEDEEAEGVFSKLFDKVKSAVSGPSSTAGNEPSQDSAASITSAHESSNISMSSFGSGLQRQQTPSQPSQPLPKQQQQPSQPNIQCHVTPSTNAEQKAAQTHISGTTTAPATANPLSSSSSLRRPIYVTAPTPPASHKDSVVFSFPAPTIQFDVTSPRSSTSTATAVAGDEATSRRHSQDEARPSLDTLDYYIGVPISKQGSVDSDTQSVMTTFSISNSNSLSRILARLRGQKRSDKEFWMRDEQCKECYKCRKPFTLLRRKHHCRTCGQIFCGKCASHIVSGKMYNIKGQARLCNFCYSERYVAGASKSYAMDSPAAPSAAIGDTEYTTVIPSQKAPLAVPHMQIPTTALRQSHSTYGNSDATTLALEIHTRGPELYRKASVSEGIPRTGANNAHWRSSLPASTVDTETLGADSGLKRWFDAGSSLLKPRPRSNTSSSAPQYGSQMPFRGNSSTGTTYNDRGGGTLVAESELSPYNGHKDEDGDDGNESDENHRYGHWNRPASYQGLSSFRMPSNSSGSSGNQFRSEQSSHTVSKLSREYAGSDDEAYGTKLRDKRTEELRGSTSPRDMPLATLRRQSLNGLPGTRTSARMRNIYINTSNLPRSDSSQSETWSPNPFLSPYINTPDDKFSSTGQEHGAFISRLIPPRHQRGSALPSSAELNPSAILHARKMLRQLMEESGLDELSEGDKTGWEEVIMSLLLKVTDLVRPDVHSGDDMDVRHYVKIKKIPGGLPSDSFYVKGVVCSKNVAHKRMVRNSVHPRILILLFSLDYSRVEMENQLLSISPVISQEREHISKLVGRIVALRPTLLLVKSTVSRLALERLLEANIPVVHNVKYSVIEAVARCTQASIVSSVDKLQLDLSFGHCGTFEIRTLIHEWIPNRRKTFLIFDDCAPELGGTVVLRGATGPTLQKIKRVIDFMVFVVNNLKLESSLLRDSFARAIGPTPSNQPSDDKYGSGRSRSPLVPRPDGIASIDSKEDATTSVNADFSANADFIANSETNVDTSADAGVTAAPETGSDIAIRQTETTDDDNPLDTFIRVYHDTILSASQFVSFPPPYLLTQLKETEDRLASLSIKRKKALLGKANEVPVSPTRNAFEMAARSTEHLDSGVDAEYENLIAKHHQLARAWDAYIGGSPEDYYVSPFYHQNIVVLYSNVCTVTTVPCQGPQIRMFEFYRYPSDMTLGQYLMELCGDAQQPCSSPMCDHPTLMHYRSYAHGGARVNVMIEKFPCPQVGMSDKLLMWSYCQECDKPTPVIPVSDDTWNYSFGKFLELFLYQQGIHCRVDVCPHEIARHHVRYFGYMNMAVRFQYDPIGLLEVAVPPMKLFMLSQVHVDIKEAELKTLRNKINKFYQSITERNKAFPFDLVDPRRLEACKAQLQEMSHRGVGTKKQVLQILQNVYATTEANDTLTINWVRRILYQEIAQWEEEYDDLVRRYLLPERELRKFTTSHLRKMFPADMSESIIHMDDERTKRATEITDLPLLGIGLDGEEDKNTTVHATGLVEGRWGASPKMLPTLSSSPTSEGGWRQVGNPQSFVKDEHTGRSIDADDNTKRHSFLRPEARRQLSMELLQELNEKFKSNEDDEDSMIRSKSPPLVQGALTPSRIPIPHLSSSNRAPLTPPVYEPYTSLAPLANKRHRMFSPSSQSTPMAPSSDGFVSMSGYRYGHRILDSLTRDVGRPSRHYHQPQSLHPLPSVFGRNYADDSVFSHLRKVAMPLTEMRRTLTGSSRDRQFRSKLPRKKTYIQVYTRANDLVKEDMEDEFSLDDIDLDDGEEQSRRRALGPSPVSQYEEDEDETVDYFSPLAPYMSSVPRESGDRPDGKSKRQRRFSSTSVSSTSGQQPVTGFGMDLDCNLPAAVELLSSPPSATDIIDNPTPKTDYDNMSTAVAPRPPPPSHKPTNVNEVVDDGRHSPEKSSFMKTITSFLTDSGMANLLPLENPLQPTEHIFPDSFVVVREDEPSTIIAYTLSGKDYLGKIHEMEEAMTVDAAEVVDDMDATTASSMMEMETTASGDVPLATPAGIQETLLRESGNHMRYNFSDGTTKFFCKIFFAEQFDALRRNCGCDESYILSLSSCIKWDSSGGKSGSNFLKTKDDRLLMKQMSRYELDAFLGFAPAYFQYMSHAFFQELPTVLAKIFGFYRIGYKNSTTGKSMRMDVLVMENLFYQRNIKKIFDLKGSMRNRHVQSTGKQDEVLLDENLVELIYQSPLFIRAHSKEILRSSLHNDTLFLSGRNVMDYSLLVGIDEERQELVVGIVDFIRTFTWDKKLESWVKESGILGGGGKEPTILSPRQYRIRFREAMERYFLMVPDLWALTRQSRSPYATLYHHHHQQQQQQQQQQYIEHDPPAPTLPQPPHQDQSKEQEQHAQNVQQRSHPEQDPSPQQVRQEP